jgi:3-dehydroquinate dehydratase-1
VRNTVIGGPDPLICIPVVAEDKKQLLDQAAILPPLSPDIVEWRVDGYKGVEDTADCLAALTALRAAIGDTPLIFTCRIEAEGGMQPISQKTRQALIQAAIRSGEIDIVDIELINDQAFIDTVRQTAQDHGVKLILSYHDFKKTPPADRIVDKLKQAQGAGADIAKVAVMPTGYGDVLTLLEATLQARTEAVTTPLVTMSMAQEGVITRMAGGLFGSDITFAIGQASSAPGQIPIGDLRQAMSLLY